MDDNWKFHRGDIGNAELPNFDDSGWESIGLPHTWNNLDGQDGGGYYQGIGWYRRHCEGFSPSSKRRCYLQFDAASLIADVYVNGVWVGHHEGGFSAFRFDVTSLMKEHGNNIIAVKVDNTWHKMIGPLQGDFTTCGGLYRSVHMIVKGDVHLSMDDDGSTGVYITPTNVTKESADLEILSKIRNDSDIEQHVTVKSIVCDAKGREVKVLTSTQTTPAHSNVDFVQSGQIKKPHLWDGVDSPYLYHVQTIVESMSGSSDTVTNPLGFRSFTVTPNGGFELNGRPYGLHGVNKHQDQWNKGWVESKADQERDIRILLELGSTAIRLCHYQHPEYTYELCDKAGLVTWAEVANVGIITVDDAYTRNINQQFTELVKQNYNHPSIFFWSIANEITNGPDPIEVLKALNETSHKLDKTRPTTIAINNWAGHATNFIPDLDAFNRYFGWYDGTFSDFETFLDSTHKDYPAMPIGMGEYGAGSSVYVHTDHPVRMDHSEEYQALYHEAYWKTLSKRPWLWCKFIWAGMDFAADARNEGDTRGRNNKGIITADRAIYKDTFYLYQANWAKTPVIHITGRRYNNRPGLTRDIKIYSNAKTVTLTVNGEEQGARSSSDCVFKWLAVPMQTGANTIIAGAEINGKTVTDTVVWNVPAGGPADGIYSLLNQGSGMVLDQMDNAGPIQNTISGRRTYLFDIESDSKGNYTIRNVVSGQYLTASGTTLHFGKQTGDSTQLWSIDQGNGAYSIHNIATGMVLDAPVTGKTAGSSIGLRKPVNSLSELWVFNPAYQLSEGDYRLQNHAGGQILNKDLSLGQPNASSRDEIWKLTALGNGYYTIINRSSKRALECNGDHLAVAKADGSTGQQWSIQMITEGVLIQNHATHRVLDTENGLHPADPSNTASQTWVLNRLDR